MKKSRAVSLPSDFLVCDEGCKAVGFHESCHQPENLSNMIQFHADRDSEQLGS